MKIIAICPHCETRIPRAFFLKTMPHVDLSCPHCERKIKSETKLEWLGDLILALPIGILLYAGAKGLLSWFIASTLIGVILFVAIWGFPYFTKFVPSKTHVESKRN